MDSKRPRNKYLVIVLVVLFALVGVGLIFLAKNNFFINNKSNEDYPSFKYVRENRGHHDLNSIGDVSILVIPVAFNDCRLTQSQIKKAVDDINKGFFGKSEDTYWESVASFYEKSSYSKLHIKGEVTSVFKYSKTVSQTIATSLNEEPTYDILASALKWYENNGGDLSKFDLNKDNYIDAIWMVYLERDYSSYQSFKPGVTSQEGLEDLLWAYTYWYLDDINTKVKPFSYSWASYYFFNEAKDEKPDAHTFIHETGHLLGLDDYYNYDYSNTTYGDKTKPIGGLDMMDFNILDHNAYSKYLLNWVNPLVIDKPGTYELNSFQKDGQCYIIPASSFHNSPCDEYLILEYYTPDGLNQKDTLIPYAGVHPKGFSENGFKIYHVDSRLGIFSSVDGSFIDYYQGEYDNLRRTFLDIAFSNTPSYSVDKDIRLLRLLSPLGDSRKDFVGPMNLSASNIDLFQKGDSLNTYTFNTVGRKKLNLKILDSSSTSGKFQIDF